MANVTISTHNGSTVAREHNIRNARIVAKEAHIMPNGVYEIWHDEAPRAAYNRLFGEAVKEYNSRQHRADRLIKNYYQAVLNDTKKHPVYEMIIGIYGRGDDGRSICSEATGKAIMRQFVDDWQQRNPDLELIGAYYHADEEGEPHVHIDYVPVAHGYTKGLAVQNGLVKALGAMGYVKCGKETAQIQWQRHENAVLEQLVRDRGIEVSHPLEEGRRHLDTALYKQHALLDSTIDNTQQLTSINEQLRADNAKEELRKKKLLNETAKILEQRNKLMKIKPSSVGNYYLCTVDPEQIIDIAKELKQYALTDKDVSELHAQLTQQLQQTQLAQKNNEDLAASLNAKAMAMANAMASKQIQAYISQIEQLQAYLSEIKLPDGRTALQAYNSIQRRSDALEL